MLFETRRFGTLRDISQTDLRDILLFMVEFATWKAGTDSSNKMAFADEVEL